MINSQIEEWKKAAQEGTIPDEQNPLFIFSLTSNALLIKIATGEFNVLKIVLMSLAAEAMTTTGSTLALSRSNWTCKHFVSLHPNGRRLYTTGHING